MNKDNQFDELLHEALSEYRDAEPLAGLEHRILERLQAQPPKRRRLWWIWRAIATCVALVLIGVWIGVKSPTTPHLPTAGKYGPAAPIDEGVSARSVDATNPAGEKPTQTPPPTVDARARKINAGTAIEINRGSASAAESRNRPSVFPLPSPLTAEEREFMTALQKDPQAATPASNVDAAAGIAEINIKPLDISGQTSGVDQ